MQIPLYGQRDSRWANHKINNTSSTLGAYGCTISCIAMAYTAYGETKNPKEMEEFMRSRGAFQNDLVLWTKVPYFRHRFYCQNTPAPIDEIKNEIREGKLVLLNVDLVANDDKPDHWVLCVDEDFTIYDPWYNEIAPITKRYGQPAREIFGGAYFNWPTRKEEKKEESMPNIDLPQEQYKASFITVVTRWPDEAKEEIKRWRESGKLPWQYVQDEYLNPMIEAYKAQIKRLSTEVETLTAKVETLSEDIDDRDQEIADMRERAEKAERRVEELSASNSDLRTELTESKEKVIDLESNLTGIPTGRIFAVLLHRIIKKGGEPI